MHKKFVALFCVGVMITIAGCGASNPETTEVTGTVTYDGEPLEGATITLVPEAGSQGARTASGKSDASGNFTITTMFPDGETKDGAVGGSYSVLVMKAEAAEMDVSGQFDQNEGDPSADYEGMVGMMTEDGEVDALQSQSLINSVFGSYTKSDNWKNEIEVVGPAEGGAPGTLKITLEDSGTGEAILQ